MRFTRAKVIVSTGIITLFFSQSTIAQVQEKKEPTKKPSTIAPAEKLPPGWDEVDQRLIFLMVRLANTETSLEAIEKTINKSDSTKTSKAASARRAETRNIVMDRKGGGPVSWNVFYGTTAEKFFYHPVDANSTYHTATVLSQQGPGADNKVGGGVPASQGLPVHQRPPQFDYIYRSNERVKARAEADVAALNGKMSSLIARRQRLEAEQAELWVEIAFRAIDHYDLNKKPLLRYEPLLVSTDPDAIQHVEIVKSNTQFMRVALSIIETAKNNQASAFKTIQTKVSNARTKFDDALLQQGVDVTEKSAPVAKFAALAKRLDDMSKNLSESYEVALEGDEAKDEVRKETFRGMLQQSLVSYAQIILAMDEMCAIMQKDWKIKPDLKKPLPVDYVSTVKPYENNSIASKQGDVIEMKIKDKENEPNRPDFVPQEALFWSGGWYWFPQQKLRFPQALALSNQKKGNLLTIENEDENKFVTSHIHGPTFIGVTKRNGVWYDVSGKAQYYFNWEKGQPNSSPGENWACILRHSYWHDYLDESQFFVVEWSSNSSKEDIDSADSLRQVASKETLKMPVENTPARKSRLNQKSKTVSKDSVDNISKNGWTDLIDNSEEYSRNWKNGDNRANYFYSDVNKTISIEGVHDLGFVSYSKPWAVFEYEMLAKQLSFENFDITVNGNTLKLGNSVLYSNTNGWARLRIQYNSATKMLGAFVNGRLVSKATVQGNDIQTHFECKFNSGGGQDVKVELRKLRIQ